MTSNAGRILWTAVVLGFVVGPLAGPLVGCADLSRGEPPGDAATGEANAADGGATDLDPAGGGDAVLSFANPIHGLLTAACGSCHAPGQEAGDTTLLFTNDQAMDYASVARSVDVATPASSPLLMKMSGRGHRGGTVYASGAPEYQTVLRWIQEGARL
ncbi:MAG: hypothetical protein H7X95_11845 [Deltaproteobacteria bacterium]|nr:hypothetical protein [Deltaproteobacteria bacterium]